MDMDALPSPSQPPPAAPTPVKPAPKRVIRRKPKLEGPQLLDGLDAVLDVGVKASRRRCEKGDEQRYLGALLRDLGRWAHRVKPDLPLANFVVDAQKLGRTMDLRRTLADQRTDAFRKSLAEARGRVDGVPPEAVTLSEDGGLGGDVPPSDGEQNGSAPAPDVVQDAIEKQSGKPSVTDDRPPKTARRLNMDIDPDDVDSVPAAAKSKTAEQLDMDIDPSDVVERSEAPKEPPSTKAAKPLDMDIDPADAMPSSGAQQNADDDYEYDMEILREFEASD